MENPTNRMRPEPSDTKSHCKQVCDDAAHWHRDTLELTTVCPPLVCKATLAWVNRRATFESCQRPTHPLAPKQGRRSTRKSSGSRRIDESTATLYELSPGIAQKISTTIIEDRAYLLRTRKTVFHAKK